MSELARIIKELSYAIQHAEAERERTRQLWQKFSALARLRRMAKGMILKELSAKTGIGQGTLHYLEHNQREWTMDRARKVMKALK